LDAVRFTTRPHHRFSSEGRVLSELKLSAGEEKGNQTDDLELR